MMPINLEAFGHNDIVVVAPLNWGMGHATRCIPLIHALKGKVKKVIVAADGASYILLQREFEDVVRLSRFDIHYGNGSATMNVLRNIPALTLNYLKDLWTARSLTRKQGVTKIISDNRFGFRNSGVHNIYICHQINITHPKIWVSAFASRLHLHFIQKFDALWIPDFQHRPLSGKLSDSANVGIPVSYLGPLTRIYNASQPKTIDILVLLSGVEPQRTIFEKLLYHVLETLSYHTIVVIRGSKSKVDIPWSSHIQVVDIADTKQMIHYLNSSKVLISRSGYSTMMDIAQLDIKAILIPTPGQTEQEYLAELASKNSNYMTLTQAQLPQMLSLELHKILTQI